MAAYEFYWKKTKDNNARLLRVMGMAPELVLPEQIGGCPLTEIDAYCFAERKKDLSASGIQKTMLFWESEYCLSEDIRLETSGMNDVLCKNEHRSTGQQKILELREICGSYVQKVILPDSIKKIGTLAFYNCGHLKEISIGKELCELGSDVFMNCRRLKQVYVRCGVKEKSAFRLIAMQISSDITVSFVDAVLLFPEYYESYDEVAPAHLFGRNIEGEGFRARQAFKDGVVDLAQYDSVFAKACAEESVDTLCTFAMNRLRYPAGLGAVACKEYETYVIAHADDICKKAVQMRDTEQILFLCEKKYVDRLTLEKCVAWAAEMEWAEGAAHFVHLKEQYFKETEKKNRYEFDEF